MRTPSPWNIPRTPFTLAQAARLGVTRAQVRTALHDGRVIRLRHGVFIAAAAPATNAQAAHLQAALAEQLRNPGLVLDRTSGGLAHGLPLLHTASVTAAPPTFVRAASPRARGEREKRRAVRTSGLLPDHHVVTLPSGLVVTSLARTAVDIAVRTTTDEALMVLDAAAHLELVALGGRPRRLYRDPRALAAAKRPLFEAAEQAGLARRLNWPLRIADARRESALESFSVSYFAEAGLPRPAHQTQIATNQGDYYPDNLWEQYRLIGEADGEGKYEDPTASTREKLRDGELRDQGYDLLHWAGTEMFRAPSRVVDRLGRLLVARGWDGVPCIW